MTDITQPTDEFVDQGPALDDATLREIAGRQAASRFARKQLGRVPERLQETPIVSNAAEYDALRPGTKFIDPDNKERVKPWEVRGGSEDSDYESIPEGAQFLDPEGGLRTKPKYEALDFTTQMLYNMAVNDKERRNALERGYPGRVKEAEGSGDLYIEEDDGTLRKSKGFTEPGGTAAMITKEFVPTVASGLGDIVGGVGGFAVGGPPGAFAGAVGGGAVGGSAGQAFNDAMLKLAGVYDRSGGEQAAALGTAALFGGGGSAVGRTVAAAYPWLKGKITQGAPGVVGGALGVDPAGLAATVRMREAGLDLAPPSIWAKEAPALINMAEVFDPAFRTQKPLLQAAEKYADQRYREMLEAAGVDVEGSVVKPTAAPSLQEAANALLERRTQALAEADNRLQFSLDLHENVTKQRGLLHEMNLLELEVAARDSMSAANKALQAGFKSIEADVDAAFIAAKASTNSGELWWLAGEKLQAVNRALRERAAKMYRAGDTVAGDIRPPLGDLPDLADAFLRQLPDNFANMHPQFVRQLRDLAGEFDAAGQMVKPPVQPTAGQLRDLRSQLRSNYNYYDLAPSIKEGTFKYFANRVNKVLHDVDAVPELKEAVKLWDMADAFYKDNVVPLMHANFNAVLKGMKSGANLAPDPKMLFNTLIKDGEPGMIRKVKEVMGPGLWGGIAAADKQSILNVSKSKLGVEGQYEAREFAAEVIDRYRRGVLEAVHGKEVSEQLIKQANAVRVLEGILPINVLPGDTLKDIIGKAFAAKEQAKEFAKKNPILALEGEMDKIRKFHAKEMENFKATDPIGFVYNPTVQAVEAVERILADENLLLAAGMKLGENSEAFKLIEQLWLQRLLQGTINPSEHWFKRTPPEVQDLMARRMGMTVDQIKLIMNDLALLSSSKAAQETGMSIQAGYKVSHPWSSIIFKGPGVSVPGADFIGRQLLGGYFKFFTEKIANNLTFLRWLERGLKGDPETRELVRQTVQRMAHRGGTPGAMAGEAAGQNLIQYGPAPPEPESEPFQASDGNWYIPDQRNPGRFVPVAR